MKKYPICKDCKYYDERNYVVECSHPRNVRPDYSRGKMERKSSCWSQRRDGLIDSLVFRTCGKRARWFEPREESK